MSKRCRHKRTSYTGGFNADLDERGKVVHGTVRLIYKCCDCGKRVVSKAY